MALALAMALMGLNPDEFHGLIGKLSPTYTKLLGAYDCLSSTCARSESSGFSSRASSVHSSDGDGPLTTPQSSRAPSVRSSDGSTPSATPTSTRPNTPLDEITNNGTRITLPDFPKKRDFLELGAHLKDSPWKVIHPDVPPNDFKRYMANKSVYYRVIEKGLLEDYPTRRCVDCDFTEPSPILFREEDEDPWSLTMVGIIQPVYPRTRLDDGVWSSLNSFDGSAQPKKQTADDKTRQIFDKWQPVSNELEKRQKINSSESPKKFIMPKQERQTNNSNVIVS